MTEFGEFVVVDTVSSFNTAFGGDTAIQDIFRQQNFQLLGV